MMEELRELNFQKLITLDYPQIESYTFAEYRKNHHEHYPIKAYCVSCEKKSWHKAITDPQFQLSYISHGTHSVDFIESLQPPIEPPTDWHDGAVMFIYDAPTEDNSLCPAVNYLNYSKQPANRWCWIPQEEEPLSKLKEDRYGTLVLNAILTFRLANAYVTHLVKCGMSNQEQQVKEIDSYNEDCIRNCFREFLSYEINILKPRVIFAFGTVVEKRLRDLIGNSYFIQPLPHPKAQQNDFSDEEVKILYFWLVLRALFKTSVITLDEVKNLTEQFLHQFDTL